MQKFSIGSRVRVTHLTDNDSDFTEYIGKRGEVFAYETWVDEGAYPYGVRFNYNDEAYFDEAELELVDVRVVEGKVDVSLDYYGCEATVWIDDGNFSLVMHELDGKRVRVTVEVLE